MDSSQGAWTVISPTLKGAIPNYLYLVHNRTKHFQHHKWRFNKNAIKSSIKKGTNDSHSSLKNTFSWFSNLRFQSLPFAGARLFNALPINIRNLTSCSKMVFKSSIDKFLLTIPDQPLLHSISLPRHAPSNTIVGMMSVAPLSNRWGQNNLVEC